MKFQLKENEVECLLFLNELNDIISCYMLRTFVFKL